MATLADEAPAQVRAQALLRAFPWFSEREKSRVCKFLGVRVIDPALRSFELTGPDMQDAVQSVWVRFVEKAFSAVKPMQTVLGYLRRVAKNCVLNSLRSGASDTEHRVAAPLKDLEAFLQDERDIENETLIRNPGATLGMDLTEREAEVLRLCDPLLGYSQAEVGARLGISQPRVSQTLARIKRRYLAAKSAPASR